MSETRSSSRRKRKRAPVKLTLKLAPEKKFKVVKRNTWEDDNDEDPDDKSSVNQDKPDYRSTQCDFCSKSFVDPGRLLKHMRKLHRQGPLVCVCHGKEFKSRKTLLSHEEKTRDGTIGRRKNYRKYSQDTLVRAYEAVKSGRMSTRKAAKEFQIPFTTLCDRIAGRISLDKMTSGPQPLLSHEDESKLCLHVSLMSAIGYIYYRQTVTQIASELAIFKGRLPENKTLSDNWYRKFVSRFPSVARKQKHLDKQFLASTDIVRKYFEEYVGLLKTHDLLNKPEKTYCLTVYELDMLKSTTKTEKRSSSGKSSDTVSVILCCNASGVALAPFFIFSGSTYSDKLLEGGLPNSQARVNLTGTVDGSMLKDFFKQHLLKLLKSDPATGEEPVVVMYNGHSMHFEVERIEWARKHGVLLFALPPHTATFKAQLDEDLKRLFHQAFKQEEKRYQKKHFGDPLTRYNICSLVSRIFPNVFVERTLAKFFKMSSICPVHPELVDPNVTFAKVDSVSDCDIEGTDAFLAVKLPFPNLADRVLQRRDHVPLQSSLRQILQKLPLSQKKNFDKMHVELPNPDTATFNEHSYVFGLGSSRLQSEREESVSVHPVIDIATMDQPTQSSGVLSPTHTLISIVPGNVTEIVPVVETQEVSSVIEIGTTDMVSILAQLPEAEEDVDVEQSEIVAEPGTSAEIAVELNETMKEPGTATDVIIQFDEHVQGTNFSMNEGVETDMDKQEHDQSVVIRCESVSENNISGSPSQSEVSNAEPRAKYALVFDTKTNIRYRILLSDLIIQEK